MIRLIEHWGFVCNFFVFIVTSTMVASNRPIETGERSAMSPTVNRRLCVGVYRDRARSNGVMDHSQ